MGYLSFREAVEHFVGRLGIRASMFEDDDKVTVHWDRPLTEGEKLRFRDVLEQAMNATAGMDYPIIRAIGAVAEQ